MGNKEFTDMKYAELERQLKTIKITFQDSTGGNDRCRSISIPQENGDIITVLCPNSIVHDIVNDMWNNYSVFVDHRENRNVTFITPMEGEADLQVIIAVVQDYIRNGFYKAK